MEKKVYGGVQGDCGTGQTAEESRVVRCCTKTGEAVYDIKGTNRILYGFRSTYTGSSVPSTLI